MRSRYLLLIALLVFGLVAGLAGCDCEEVNVGQAPKLVVKPKAVVFPSVGVGNKVTEKVELSNQGNAPLQVKSITLDPDGDKSYRLTKVPDLPLELKAGEKSTIEVEYAPTEAGTPKSAVWIESNDPDTEKTVVPLLTASNQPQIQVKPSALDFGFVEKGRVSSKEVTIRNIGNADLHVQKIYLEQIGKDFSLPSGQTLTDVTIAPDKEVVFKVHYSPTDAGGDSGTLWIESDDGVRPKSKVTLVGRRSEPDIQAKPLVLDFGGVAPNSSRALSLAIENRGGAVLTITNIALDPGPDKEFSAILPSLPLQVKPNSVIKVATFYRPINKGLDNGLLTISSDDPDTPELKVRLVGQSPPAGIVVRPLLLDFGGIPVNGSRSLSVTVANTGAKPVKLTGTVIDSPSKAFQVSPAPSVPVTILPNSSTVVNVAYSPPTNARHKGTLTIQSDDLVQPEVKVELVGTTVAAPPCFLKAKPSAMNFGNVAVGKSKTIQVDITNAGSGSCVLFGLKLSFASDFSFLMQSGQLVLPKSLGPNAVHRASVSFTPTTARPAFGTLEVSYGVSLFQRLPSLNIPLTGMGDGPAVCVEPSVVDFGGVALTGKKNEIFQIRSCGTRPVTISKIVLAQGANPAFSLAQLPTLPTTLAPGNTVAVTSAFAPTVEGPASGLVEIHSDAAGTPISHGQLYGYGIKKGQQCGAVRGRICATDKVTWMSNATVSITLANGKVIQTKTDKDGYFYLSCVPAGNHQVKASKGSFQVDFQTTVVDNQTQDLKTPVCFDATKTKIAVVWGEYDEIQLFLDKLGLTYTFYGQSNGADLLGRYKEMIKYDIIFINCGADESVINGAMGQRLQNFVKQGGSVYMSDFAYDFLEVGWPNVVDWVGNDASRGAAESAGGGTVQGTVHDATLIHRLGGLKQVPIQYKQCPCAGALSVQDKKVAVITGDRMKTGDKTQPLAVLFQPDPTGGHVAYTTFHNTEQSDRLISILMRYFIFEL